MVQIRNIRILIIDDSSFMRSVIKRTIESVPDMVVIGEAHNGEEGVELTKSLHPDCVITDINMPVMNGLDYIKAVMSKMPLPIIVFSAHAKKDGEATIMALEYGAFDFIRKPSGEVSTNIDDIKDNLIEKIRLGLVSHIRRVTVHNKNKYDSELKKQAPNQRKISQKIIAIGISTGGPNILRDIIPLFGNNIGAAIVISQHMPPVYTNIFAEQLNKTVSQNVVEAKESMKLFENSIYICPGNKNLTINDNKINLLQPEDKCIWTPSVNTMFESVAEYGRNCIAVVMTGLGSDGTKGIMTVKERGGTVIAQNEDTSVVFGMPKSAIDTGLVDFVLSARAIPLEIKKLLKENR